ncbi:hypothetical protein ABEB36_000371 [Hypothenemus hampei]|uniref:Uncharacterized protein n=1 Tax=Hypothenemus hampei TaxID=57062 RepID=A0ABD1FB04_HYPHA
MVRYGVYEKKNPSIDFVVGNIACCPNMERCNKVQKIHWHSEWHKKKSCYQGLLGMQNSFVGGGKEIVKEWQTRWELLDGKAQWTKQIIKIEPWLERDFEESEACWLIVANWIKGIIVQKEEYEREREVSNRTLQEQE